MCACAFGVPINDPYLNSWPFASQLNHIIEMASPARSSLLRTKAWIGGKWRAALSENTFPVYNPANNELIAEVYTYHHEINYNGRSVRYLAGDTPSKISFCLQVPDMGAEDVDVAVQDAYANQKLWAATTVKVLHPLSTTKINLLATPILYELFFFLTIMQERSSVLRKLNDLMLANKQDLGQIISLETVGG